MIVQKTYMPCGVRPKNVQDFARRLHVSSATVLRIARTHSCLATIARRTRLQKAAVGTPHEGLVFIVALQNKMYNSQRKTSFKPLSPMMASLPYQLKVVQSKGRDVYSKRRKSWCYLLTIAQLRYGLRMAELFNIQLKVHSGRQHEKSSWICLAAVLRLKTSCEFRSKRNWSSTIRLLYGFTISYRGPAAALSVHTTAVRQPQ